MCDGIRFLFKQKRLRMREIVLSKHHTYSGIDWRRLGANKSFCLFPTLSVYVRFELRKNNKCCIPMGGSSSAQSADFDCLWGASTGHQAFGRLGAGDTTVVCLSGGEWKVALCLFRNNILLATNGNPMTPVITKP